MKYAAIVQNGVSSQNSVIMADGFSSITLKNLGESLILIDDNIPLEAGELFTFDNHPNVIIKSNISIRFKNLDKSKKLLFIKTYNTEL